MAWVRIQYLFVDLLLGRHVEAVYPSENVKSRLDSTVEKTENALNCRKG